MSAKPAPKKVDVIAAAYELATVFKEDPKFVERDLLQQGDELLSFFEDPNFSNSFQDMLTQKSQVIQMAIQDISGGVMTLRSSTIGVAFRGRTLSPYVAPHGTSPNGTVVYSIGWKNLKSFQNWRSEDGGDISQDQINTAIYRLAAALAELI